jgi:hypothetical protein
MKIFIRILIFVMVLFGGRIPDAGCAQIELKDGSIMSGDVVSLNNGIYTIRTGSLGTISIPISQVRSIVNAGPRSDETKNGSDRIYHPKFEGQVKSLQEQMTGDEELTKGIMSLMDDPEYIDIIQDQDILEAIRTGDTEKLQANPKMNRLMKNPKFMKIYKRLP